MIILAIMTHPYYFVLHWLPQLFGDHRGHLQTLFMRTAKTMTQTIAPDSDGNKGKGDGDYFGVTQNATDVDTRDLKTVSYSRQIELQALQFWKLKKGYNCT